MVKEKNGFEVDSNCSSFDHLDIAVRKVEIYPLRGLLKWRKLLLMYRGDFDRRVRLAHPIIIDQCILAIINTQIETKVMSKVAYQRFKAFDRSFPQSYPCLHKLAYRKRIRCTLNAVSTELGNPIKATIGQSELQFASSQALIPQQSKPKVLLSALCGEFPLPFKNLGRVFDFFQLMPFKVWFISGFNFYFDQIRYFRHMSKPQAKAPAGKPSTQPSKAPEKKAWKAEDFATLTIPVEEVRDIKTAFDIFDGDLSGVVDPQELKRAFEQLGFGGQNKFVYQILAELDDDQSGGIDFAEFLRLATAKLSDKDSRVEVDKVWTSFDINKAGKITTHELKKVAKDLGEDLNDEEIEKIFVKADLDDDGFVSADDFYNILTHKVYWEQ